MSETDRLLKEFYRSDKSPIALKSNHGIEGRFFVQDRPFIDQRPGHTWVNFDDEFRLGITRKGGEFHAELRGNDWSESARLMGFTGTKGQASGTDIKALVFDACKEHLPYWALVKAHAALRELPELVLPSRP